MELSFPRPETDRAKQECQSHDSITNEILCMRVQAGENVSDNLLLLYNRNRPLIAEWCKRYAAFEDIEDLMQECFLIVAYAAQLFDPEAGANFCTFLKVCIRTGLIKYMRTSGSLITLPEGMRHKIAQYAKFNEAFILEKGRSPKSNECMAALGISYDQYRNIITAISGTDISSLDAVYDDISLYETIPDDGDSIAQIEDSLTHQQNAEEIRAAVDKLNPSERNVINAYFYEGKSFKEMSEIYGLKQSRLRAQKDYALRKLRRDKSIISIGHDYGYGTYIYKGGIGRWKHTGYSSTEYAAILHLEGFRDD